MRRKPKRDMTDEQEEAAEEFISGAKASSESASTSPEADASEEADEVYPWQEPQVREDVKQTYPLRLPEPLHLKLKFLSEKTGKSMNELCNDAVSDLVEEKLPDVT